MRSNPEYVGGPLVAGILSPEDVDALRQRRPDLVEAVAEWGPASQVHWALVGVDSLSDLADLEFIHTATRDLRQAGELSARGVLDWMLHGQKPFDAGAPRGQRVDE